MTAYDLGLPMPFCREAHGVVTGDDLSHLAVMSVTVSIRWFCCSMMLLLPNSILPCCFMSESPNRREPSATTSERSALPARSS